MSQPQSVCVGNAGGYWGDDPDALYRQLTQGDLDYITVDFLAEVTMSVLQIAAIPQSRTGICHGFSGPNAPVPSRHRRKWDSNDQQYRRGQSEKLR